MSSPGLSRRTVVAGLGALAAAPGFAVAASPRSRDSFLALGDWGRKGARQQRAVAQAMASRARDIGSRFVVTVGDNFYAAGVRSTLDGHWRQSFTDVYDLQTLHTWYPALGNHDHNGDPDIQVAYSQHFAGWRMDGRYYRQTVALSGGRTLDLFVLDTAPIADPSSYAASRSNLHAQWGWFDREMLASRADWKIVVGHHPILSSGYKKRDFSLLNRWLEPRLQRYGVHAYLAGHDHHLEYIHSGGVAHIISGGGSEGDALARRCVAGHVQGWPSAGFTAFEIAGDVMTVTFIDAQGRDLGAAQVLRQRRV
ncbi:metallophosphoesterase [Phenylobacterium sp. LjRoot219]|uniref:metallophosphoesterase n=1 Tax=Phenylobacterium sp. LjRoot219 TaxID=3342283 RepID=UPI003ED0453E